MKIVVRNNKEKETGVKDTWYALISESELEGGENFCSPLFSCKDEATSEATEEYDETMYVAEVKLITKVVG